MLIFSLPNMEVMLKRKYTNCINFEHTIFLTENYVEHLLSKFGFKISRKEYFREDHSIFYAAIRDNETKILDYDNNLYEINKKIYNDYIYYHHKLVIELNDKILKHQGPIYLFGAHVFSQYLLSFGLNRNLIDSVLDNDSNKQGKRLYGTNLLVQSPEILRNKKNSAVILRAGVYNEEIKSQISSITNKNVIYF